MNEGEKMTKEKNFIKVFYFSFCFLFCLPSFFYLVKHQSILSFHEWFTFFLKKPISILESSCNAIAYLILLLGLFFFFFLFYKKAEVLFSNIKEVFLFLIPIGLCFSICLPFTTSDLFYYMGTGWLDSNYHENPYITTVDELKEEHPNDEILMRTGVWGHQKVVYGPLWSLISKGISKLSFGNVTGCYFLYKVAAFVVYLFSCILIYQMTKKISYVLLYGANPFVLIEGLANAHNDIYFVFFLLLCFYFLIRKKNLILALFSLAMATAIKYLSVLILPFLLLYTCQNQTLFQKIIYCFKYGILFCLFVFFFYAFYIQDIKIFFVMLMQQSKLRESLLFLIYLLSVQLKKVIGISIYPIFKYGFYLFFLFLYFKLILKFLNQKEITIKEMMTSSFVSIFIFLFFIITNLCPWYLLWFYPFIYFLEEKKVNFILILCLSYECCLFYNLSISSESYVLGILYIPTMIILFFLFRSFCSMLEHNKKYLEFGKR